MTIVFLPQFVRDLQEHGDANFAKRVLRRVLASDGSFRIDANDHRYDGIDGGWIRYVSEGKSAYRAIYVRKGDDIYLYRAGEHSIERKLPPPSTYAGINVEEESALPTETSEVHDSETSVTLALSVPPQFLRNQPKYSLHAALIGRRLIPHKEVYLVSPFVSLDYLYRTSRVGKMLRDLKEDGCKITLITRPIETADALRKFEELDDDGIQLMFHPLLHAKVYAFLIDASRTRTTDKYDDLIVVGSANLTYDGIVEPQKTGHEELCVALGPSAVDGMETYILELMNKSMDLVALKLALARRKPIRC